MRRTLAACLVTVLSQLSPAPAAQTARDCSFGEWPFLVGNMDGRIAQMVADARNNDLDAIYINFFRATGPRTGTLWITDPAGRWNAAWGPVRTGGTGINLVNLISAAHASNLQVIAVMKCFDETVQPSDLSHRQYLWDVVDYLVNSYDASGRPVYDVDGIALDYVRFVSASGAGGAQLVTDFVKGVKQRCGALTVHGYMITGRYDFDGPVYDGVFKSYATVRDTIANGFGQHWEQLARWTDVFMPMAYTADGSIYNTYALHQAYVRCVTQYIRQACVNAGFPNRRVSPTIRTYSDSETCTAATVEASITGALLGGANGYQAFRYGTLIPHLDWMAKMKQYAAPGPNRPLPALAIARAGLGTTLDASASRDFDEPAAGLQVRFDHENDGVFDTPWLANVPLPWLARNPGTWRLGLAVRDAQGNEGATTRRLVIPDVLALDRTTLSGAAGGSTNVTLDVGPATAGLTYLVCASLSGTAPGTPLAPGYVMPLNFDSLTWTLISLVNTPVLASGFGTLPANGRAVATFNVPPGLAAPLAGHTLHFAATGVDPSFQFRFVTNPRGLGIVP